MIIAAGVALAAALTGCSAGPGLDGAYCSDGGQLEAGELIGRDDIDVLPVQLLKRLISTSALADAEIVHDVVETHLRLPRRCGAM